MSLKDDLVAAFKAAAAEPPKPVDLTGFPPGFPQFYVRPVTVGEVDEQNAKKDEWADAHRLTVGSASVICDADGTLLFDPSNREEMDLIFKQSWPRMQNILKAMDVGDVSGN